VQKQFFFSLDTSLPFAREEIILGASKLLLSSS